MAKIVNITSDMNFAGVGRYLSLLDQNLESKKDQFFLIIPEGSILIDKINHMEVLTCKGIEDRSFSLEGLKALYEIVKKIQPDIIHCHGALSGRVVGKLLSIPTVFTKHTLSPPTSGIKKQFKKIIHRFLNSYAIAVSQAAYDNLINEGFDSRRLKLIYNGIDLVHTDFAARETLNILFVGRLETIKGPDECLNVISHLDKIFAGSFNVTIAGDGTLRGKLQERVKKECLPVQFLGHVEDIDRLYQQTDLVVNTSSSEALGYVALEAMNYEKPIIAYDIPGINEVIKDKENGFLVQPFDTKDFAEKCAYLLSNPVQAEEMGEKGKKILEEKFSVQQMIERLWKVYEEIL